PGFGHCVEGLLCDQWSTYVTIGLARRILVRDGHVAAFKAAVETVLDAPGLQPLVPVVRPDLGGLQLGKGRSTEQNAVANRGFAGKFERLEVLVGLYAGAGNADVRQTVRVDDLLLGQNVGLPFCGVAGRT